MSSAVKPQEKAKSPKPSNGTKTKTKTKEKNGSKKNGSKVHPQPPIIEAKKTEQKRTQLRVERDDDYTQDIDIDLEEEIDEDNQEMTQQEMVTFSPEEIANLLDEYFDHQDTAEFIDNAKDVVLEFEIAAIKKILNVSLDKKDPMRELVSELLLALNESKIVTKDHIKFAFQSMMKEADIIKDVPDFNVILSKFIARAIGDGLLNTRFIDENIDKKASELAKTHLSYGNGRLHAIWGAGNKPVKVLADQMSLAINEYLVSGDTKEAGRLLYELGVPHFHHEFIYRSILIGLEKIENWERIIILFKSLSESQIVTNTQFTEGYQRVMDNINSLRLDFPNIFKDFSRILETSCDKGIITQKLVEEMPSIARKRHASSTSHN